MAERELPAPAGPGRRGASRIRRLGGIRGVRSLGLLRQRLRSLPHPDPAAPRRNRAARAAVRRQRLRPRRPPGRQIRVRQLHRRFLQPPGLGGRQSGVRTARRTVQPAVHLRGGGFGENPPVARRQPPHHRHAAGGPHPLRHLGKLRQRVHRQHTAQANGRVQATLPKRKSVAGGRHPVLRGQGTGLGRSVPHLQRPVRSRPADGPHLRPPSQGSVGHRGAPPLPVHLRIDDRHRPPRCGNQAGHPPQQRRAVPSAGPR